MRDFEHIRQTVNEIDEDVVTLYLHVDPGARTNQSTPRGWEIYMKSALNDIEKNHIDNPDNNSDWKALRSRIEDFARDYNPEGGQSLVMFVGDNTFHTHEIRVQLDNSHSYGEPMIVPLLWAVDGRSDLDGRVDARHRHQRAGGRAGALVGKAVERAQRLDVDAHPTMGRRPGWPP